MKKLIQQLYNPKNISLICLAVLLLSLLPLLYVGQYNHPTGDDIYYGLDAHMIWEKTHSLPQTIKNALQGVAHDYQTWQGTYVAMFIMRLQPSVFSDRLYSLTPFLIIGLLLLGNGYLLSQISHYILPMNRYELLGTWSVLMTISLQWVISPGEAFYWYNGSMYYSGFYGITMLLYGLLCKYIFTCKKTTLFCIFLLEFLVGGSNYLTLLWTMLVLLLLVAWSWLKKHPKRLVLTITALFQIACFAVSAIAPGNAVRQETSAQMSAAKTILYSLRQGTKYLSIWLNGWWVIGTMLLLLFVIPAIRKINFRFPHPFLVTAFLYGMFCTLSCPTFYAQSNSGPARALNIMYYAFILTSYISFLYLAGWIYNECKNLSAQLQSLYPAYCKLLVFVFMIQVCIGFNDGTIKLSSSVQALQDIMHGTASAYDQEYHDRILLLENSEESHLILKPYKNQPLTIYVGDYGAYADQSSNQALAKWYGHDSVIIDYGGSATN